MGIDDFNYIFSGILLQGDESEYKAAEFKNEFKRESRKKINKILIVSALPFILICMSAICLLKNGGSAIWPVLFAFLTFVGFIITVLLNWYEIDQYNPALKQICSFGEKTSCDAIINSKAAKIFGISWAKIGFAYFFGSLFTLLTTGILNHSILGLLSIINILTLPYIIFSVFYQGVVAKKWCPLCLAIQGILALQFCISFMGGFTTQLKQVSLNDLFPIIMSFTLSYYIVELLFPALLQSKKYKTAISEFRQLKLNPGVFNSLLKEQEQIQSSSEGLGLEIGCPTAKHKIVMASNPYCDPCSRAHKVIEQLMENNEDVQVRILFPSGGGKNKDRIQAIRHLLYIGKQDDKPSLKKALGTWYGASEKDYKEFAKNFPIGNENLKNFDHDIEDMSTWCKRMDVNVTPTFFVNGFKLPEIYNVNDLTYLLSI